MNKKQSLLILFFAIGIVCVIAGLDLKNIWLPMTKEDLDELRKEILQSKYCQPANDCPIGPFPSKAPYMGIGQSLYYIGVASLISGAITIIKNGISITKRFLPHWICFVGVIMTAIVLGVTPILIPQLETEPYCIEPLCPVGHYWTTNLAIAFPLLFAGIAMAAAGGAIYLIKSG